MSTSPIGGPPEVCQLADLGNGVDTLLVFLVVVGTLGNPSQIEVGGVLAPLCIDPRRAKPFRGCG